MTAEAAGLAAAREETGRLPPAGGPGDPPRDVPHLHHGAHM
jgi:hypothetical protein